MKRQLLSLFILFSLLVNVGLQASDSATKEDGFFSIFNITQFKKDFKGGCKEVFKKAGENLPWQIVTIAGGWFWYHVVKKRVTSSYDRQEKQQFFDMMTQKLQKQKNQLDDEWDQMQQDRSELGKLQKKLESKVKAKYNPGLVTRLKKLVLLKSNETEDDDIEELKEDVSSLKGFLEKHKQDHLKRRDKLADMIDTYYDQYQIFMKKTNS